ncbi:MAG: methyltransferase domain-containing protein [Proteobacteria bacterium]|nr:methyltransferase domain-containing protein [Pseudomonadota bacterium]
MLARLALLAFTPATVLDLGTGLGHGAQALKRRWPRATVAALDSSAGMLARARSQSGWLRGFHRLRGEALALPVRSGALDLVWSCLLLPQVTDLDAALAEVRRVLAPRGYFTFATLGPDTLRELRAALGETEAARRVHRFPDMHDVGDALARAGFAEPVMDVERLTFTYGSIEGLYADLRAAGATGALAARPRALTGRRRLAALAAAYEAFRDVDGRLPATVEVVYGQAWGPGVNPPKRGRRTETVIPIESLRRR